jgi:SPOR domain
MGVETAAADRLPWLADEPAPRRTSQRRPRGLLLWAIAAAALVAGGSFWMGVRSVEEQAAPPPQRVTPTMTVQLPPPRAAAPAEIEMPAQPEVQPNRVPEIRPAPSREVRIAAPPHAQAQPREKDKAAPVEQTSSEDAQQSQPAPAPAAPVAAVPPVQPFVMPKPWNPRIFAGAAGRVVQIGAFGSVTQAKRGWWFMVREYPAMAHLPAVVRPTRNSKGRVFYRFQVGTTSQAHSEVLCQRMQKIRFSCAVVGLPWKAKVER